MRYDHGQSDLTDVRSDPREIIVAIANCQVLTAPKYYDFGGQHGGVDRDAQPDVPTPVIDKFPPSPYNAFDTCKLARVRPPAEV